jgi:hypothetical protein
MNRSHFNNGMAALLNGFSYAVNKVTPESEEIYWDMLQDVPSDIWQVGVRKALSECMFFPTIHELGVCCFGETKEHTEERCDPLRFKQNYQVKIEAKSWRENMADVLAERARAALPPPAERPRLAAPINPEVLPPVVKFDGRDYLERIWRMQDAAELPSFNNPEWYTERLKAKPAKIEGD